MKGGMMAKVRLSHVTNSSSSSFVISSPPGQSLNTKLTLEIDIEEFVEHTIKTEKELREYYKDHYFQQSVEDDPEYQTCLEAIKAGKEVKFIEVRDYGESGDALSTLVRRQCFYQDETNIKKNLPAGIEVIIDETY